MIFTGPSVSYRGGAVVCSSDVLSDLQGHKNPEHKSRLGSCRITWSFWLCLCEAGVGESSTRAQEKFPYVSV